METNSSGEELLVKTRKPYTITKQREKWTEEEHNKFIEALKLYGRAWQRIEEHIGTKTAVQIRSHAQKFFTKLEKEAAMKGVSFGPPHDLEIPPPRPKRKPSSPYPKKPGALSLSPSMEAIAEKISKSPSPLSASTSKRATDTEHNAAWKIQGAKYNSEDGGCSEVLNLFQDAPATSLSSSVRACNGFMPLEKEMRDNAMVNRPSLFIENGGLKGFSIMSQVRSPQEEEAEKSKQTDKTILSGDNLQGDRSKNIPFDFMKRSDGNANAKLSLNPAVISSSEVNTNSRVSSVYQPFPGFQPFNQFSGNQDPYRSFLDTSSSFSSLIVSTLLQNPAVHAAARVAGSFWPPTDSSSESVHAGIPIRPVNPNPSMAAIAAATVAAASAWWATQGLLPIYPPLHAGFAFAPPTAMIPTVDTAQVTDNKKEGNADTIEHSVGIDQQSEAVRSPQPLSKTLSLSSSSDRDETARGGAMAAKAVVIDDSDMASNKKKLDRSSCGSNTPSSSEVETDAIPKMQDGDKDDEPNQIHLSNNPQLVETNNRRTRSTNFINDSWKEVSEEGRLAFQALFNRQVLPQSFSPPHPIDPMLMKITNELPVDLNLKASSEPTDLYHAHGLDDATTNGKLKARRTGFKPYKRCSVEANDSRATTSEENGNKRIRLEGEASI